jgi:tetratricopeptide (TPR) repeat protein
MTMQIRPVPSSSGERTVRVFVSSTFLDMHGEREELVKRIFPRLRKRCEERGVTWGEVDLRWGITDEQRAEGKVLPICLAEIDRTRPFFLGLLGERYGWIPTEIPPELIEQEPWLAQHRDHSVTELEMLHGVLRNPEMAEHAYFYFRDPGYVATLPEKSQATYRDTAELADKLEALKQRIRDSGFPVHEDYPNPKALGELVFQDLVAVIDRQFPEGSTPDPLDREAAEHEAFAASRTGVYVGRREYFQALDAHALGQNPPLVVLGESGAGKSALLANWATGYRQAHPKDLVLMHFVGASPHSTDWAAMLRRLMNELGRRYGIEEEIPDAPEQLRLAFAHRLHMAAARGRSVLVIDALNQLEDRYGAPDLIWLPPVVPANVRLVLSTLPGRPLDELRKREWPTLGVGLLELRERQQLLTQYLGQYTKVLSPTRAERITSSPQAANPLFLRTLLEELRLWGDHETLDEAIGYYLAAETIDDLFERVLARYEIDYEAERPGLVRDTMSALWAARRGLSEAELRDLLGTDGEPLPQAFWTPLYLATEPSLVRRSGLIGFFHDYLRQAVRDRYLPQEGDQAAVHLLLADYFNERKESARAVDELPWQLAQAAAWQRLYCLLVDLPFLQRVMDVDEFETRAYWAQVERASPFRMVDAYRTLIEEPAQHDYAYVWRIARLLELTGHPVEALPLRRHLVDYFRRTGNLAELQVSLQNLGVNHRLRGEQDQAMALYKEQEQICRQLGNFAGLQASFGNQAVILVGRGELDTAMALHKQEERICRELGDRRGLHVCIGNQGVLLERRGLLDQAMTLFKEQERICRELDDLDGLQQALGRQATILSTRGELDQALALHKEEERICRELGDRDGLQLSLGNQGTIFSAQGDSEQALAHLREQERICRELENSQGLQYSLGNQAAVLQAEGELDQALTLFKEQERICRKLGDRFGLQYSLGYQGAIHTNRGELDTAIALFEEQERICRDLGDPRGLQASLNNRGVILREQGKLDAAMALHKEQEQISRELGDPEGIASSLCCQGIVLANAGRADQALALVEEAYSIAVNSGLMRVAGQIDSVRAKLRET